MGMNKKLYSHIFIILLCFSVNGQTINIKGALFDKEQRRISNGVIFLNPGNLATTSDKNGEFAFTCLPGKKQITTRVMGFRLATIKLDAVSDTVISIFLQVDPFELNEVIVIADSVKTTEVTARGSFILTPASQHEAPKLFSEPDLLKSFQILPGVVSGKDGSSDIYVRGGGTGQNIIYANGCYFFLSGHLLGLTSPYDIDFLESAELIKDYFPSEFGGGASSVIHLNFKNIRSDSLKAQLRLGLLSSGVIIQMPFRKINLTAGVKRGNYSIYAPLLKAITAKHVGDFLPPNNYSFYDGYLQLSHSSSKLGNMRYLFFGNYDNGKTRDKTTGENADTSINYISGIATGWNNMVHAFQWNLPAGQKKWRLDLNYNRISYKRDIYMQTEKFLVNDQRVGFEETSFSFSPVINNIGAAIVLINENKRFSYTAGISNRLRFFSPNVIATSTINDSVRKNEYSVDNVLNEPAIFLTSTVSLSDKILMNAGARLSGGFTEDIQYYIFEPRLRIDYKPGSVFSHHINYVRLSQFDHSVEGSNIGLRSMLWLPVSKNFGPEVSDIISTGIQGRISNNYVWTFDAYVKKILGMVDFKPGASFLYNKTFDDLLDRVKGRAYGIETFIVKRTGRITGSASYTYSRSKREWGSSAGLIWIPSNADRPHNGNITMKYYLNKKLSMGFNWIFTSGSPATIYSHDTQFYKWYETKNNIRYPDYHRLDLSLRRTFKLNKFFINLDFDIYNVYNRKNTFYLQETYDEKRKTFIYRNVSLFPVMPSLTMTIKY